MIDDLDEEEYEEEEYEEEEYEEEEDDEGESEDGGGSFQDISENLKEIIELPQTSDLRIMAIVNPDLNYTNLCIIVYTKDEEGTEKAHARIDFDTPEEIVDFAKSLISASKQIFAHQAKTVLN